MQLHALVHYSEQCYILLLIAARWERTFGNGCRLVKSCTYTLDVSRAGEVDGILFPIGRPNRERLKPRCVFSNSVVSSVQVAEAYSSSLYCMSAFRISRCLCAHIITAAYTRATTSAVRWLPSGALEVRDLNPRVPSAVMITEGDDVVGNAVVPPSAAFRYLYDLLISYVRGADIVHGQVRNSNRRTLPVTSLSLYGYHYGPGQLR